ncbi:hypothetical protein HK103_001224 [Boothiomyces macroporosus]|uniref:Uncharacterized protein n=1 Tax=Boothiomyces macroporosus TaxID=261099 RepID=A0AAD5UP61_9FUNG|nr:hypothetical protein HK103_001224 [Boothiomyces macroporosus]
MNIFKYTKALTVGDYYREKDPKTAFENYLVAAEMGSTISMQNVAFYYKTGKGVEMDLAKSFEWTRKAAELGRTVCMNILGTKYHTGEGTEKNWNLALEWYQKAAEKGNKEALYNMGKLYSEKGPHRNLKKAVEYYLQSKMGLAYNNIAGLYYDGELGKDYGKALHWFKKADGARYINAYNLLGMIYSSSKYNKKDVKNAIHFYTLAADNKVNASRLQLASIYRNKEYFDEPNEYMAQMYELQALEAGFYKFRFDHSLLNVDELHSNPDLLCKEVKEKAGQGMAEYQNIMGILHYKGFFDTPPLSHGGWFLKAAENGNIDAMYNLKIYESALISPASLKYLDYFQKTDFPETNFILATYYLNGAYVEKDLTKAIAYYEKSMLGGFAYAAYALYKCYKAGLGVETDEEKATFYLNEAAKEIVDAQFEYGRLCGDVNEASMWLSLAAINKHPKANDMLEKLVNST